MIEREMPVDTRYCFNWLPRYKYSLLTYKSLQQTCAFNILNKSSSFELDSHFFEKTDINVLLPYVRPVLIDMVLETDNWCGYVNAQYKDNLIKFQNTSRLFFPLTEDIALIVAKPEGSEDLLNNVLPYMSPAPQTLSASLALSGNYFGISDKVLMEFHNKRKNTTDLFKQDIAQRYGISQVENILIHAAGVDGIIEAATKYVYNNNKNFISCIVTPDYWETVRLILTYSPKGLHLIKGREQTKFPLDNWLSCLGKKDIDFAYISFTCNPLGKAIPSKALNAALETVSEDTLFFIDCTPFDTKERSSISKLSRLIKQYKNKNIIITKSFSKEYDLGDLRLGYALFTRTETARAIWPYMQCNPPVSVVKRGMKALQKGNFKVKQFYRSSNDILVKTAKKIPDLWISGSNSNYTSIFFKDEETAIKVQNKVTEKYGKMMYPGELPMRGGGDIGIGEDEVDTTTMKNIPFLAPNALRLLVSERSVKFFFSAVKEVI